MKCLPVDGEIERILLLMHGVHTKYSFRLHTPLFLSNKTSGTIMITCLYAACIHCTSQQLSLSLLLPLFIVLFLMGVHWHDLESFTFARMNPIFPGQIALVCRELERTQMSSNGSKIDGFMYLLK